MDKITYLAELAEGLARWVPERERQDILRYYAEYFGGNNSVCGHCGGVGGNAGVSACRPLGEW